MPMYFRRRKPIVRRSAEEIAAEKAAKAAVSMTCQVCGRPIFAQTGVIAHHGYTRPYEGVQTASCPGARHLPFEVDRAALEVEIDDVKRRIKAVENRIEETSAVDARVPFTYGTRDRDRRGRYADKTVWVAPTNWAEAYALYETERRWRSAIEPTYERCKLAFLNTLSSQRQQLGHYLNQQQVRYEGWRQTHRAGWRADEPVWVAI